MSVSHPVWIRAKYRYRHRHHCQHHHHSPSSDFAKIRNGIHVNLILHQLRLVQTSYKRSCSDQISDRPVTVVIPSPHVLLIDCPRQPLRRRSDLYPMAKCKHETEGHDADNWQGTNAYCMKVADFLGDRIVPKKQILSIVFAAEDELPKDVLSKIPRRVQAVPTTGDGACALHAVFGRPSDAGLLFAPHARKHARTCMESAINYPNMKEHLKKLTLWGEFALPSLQKCLARSIYLLGRIVQAETIVSSSVLRRASSKHVPR